MLQCALRLQPHHRVSPPLLRFRRFLSSGPGARPSGWAKPPLEPAAQLSLFRQLFDGGETRAAAALTQLQSMLPSSFPSISNPSLQPVDSNNRKSSAGSLLGLTELSDARRGYAAMVQRTVRECKEQIELLHRDGPERVVEHLDHLSNSLCKAVDLCEFVRQVHPDPIHSRNAHAAYMQLATFMNELNTDESLYKALASMLSSSQYASQLSQSQLASATTFLKEFEESGIHLPRSKRDEFIRIMTTINELGIAFVQPELTDVDHDDLEKENSSSLASSSSSSSSGNVPDFLDISPDILAQLPADARRAVLSAVIGKSETGKMRLLAQNGPAIEALLSFARDPAMRQLAYNISQASQSSRKEKSSSADRQIQILEKLLMARNQLAQLMNAKSYAHFFLADKMAKTPENAIEFLESLGLELKPLVDQDSAVLVQLKQEHEPHSPTAGMLSAADREHYSAMRRRSMLPNALAQSALEYFSLGTIFAGLVQLLETIYGVTIVPELPNPTEVWHPTVRKVSVVDLTSGGYHRLGTVYLDLWEREGKQEHPCHYTLQCSKLLSKGWQEPIVVISCGFRRNLGGLSLLNLTGIETYWHEWGHALHSMFARTEYQNISGTRITVDMVEAPSTLMELFATDPRILSRIALHYRSNRVIPPALLTNTLETHFAMAATSLQTQVLYSLSDLVYHGPEVPRNGSSTRIYRDLRSRLLMGPYDVGYDSSSSHGVPAETWQANFTHLHSYGASYYSYVYGRAIATNVFNRLYDKNPWAYGAGLPMRDEVLKWGKGRNLVEGFSAVGGVQSDGKLGWDGLMQRVRYESRVQEWLHY